MNDQDMQMGELLENEAVRQFLQLLTENRPDQGQDYSMMLWQVDNMADKLNRALAEPVSYTHLTLPTIRLV